MTHFTISRLVALPVHNLNRDETGAPKQVIEGGVLRAVLSSASIKRAGRVAFERSLPQDKRSIRTARLAELVEREVSATRTLDEKQTAALTRRVNLIVDTLILGSERAKARDTKKADAKTTEPDDVGNTAVYLSPREVTRIAQLALNDLDIDRASARAAVEGKTESIPVALGGRMFAAAFSQEAAIEVSPAVTVHEASIEMDFGTAVDDAAALFGDTGAAHMRFDQSTSGVYFQTTRIDLAQLARNLDYTPEMDEELAAAFQQYLIAVPTGGRSRSAAVALPSFMLVEKTRQPAGYSFHTPVSADDGGGYLAPAIESLITQAKAHRAFMPSAYDTTVVAGVDVASTSLDGLVADVVSLDGVSDLLLDEFRAIVEGGA